MSIFLSFLATLLASLAKAWLGEQQANSNAIALGASKQALASEEQANAIEAKAANARSDFKPYTAEQVRDLPPGSDPNFRD